MPITSPSVLAEHQYGRTIFFKVLLGFLLLLYAIQWAMGLGIDVLDDALWRASHQHDDDSTPARLLLMGVFTLKVAMQAGLCYGVLRIFRHTGPLHRRLQRIVRVVRLLLFIYWTVWMLGMFFIRLGPNPEGLFG